MPSEIPFKNKEKTVLYVGRIHPEKGIGELMGFAETQVRFKEWLEAKDFGSLETGTGRSPIPQICKT